MTFTIKMCFNTDWHPFSGRAARPSDGVLSLFSAVLVEMSEKYCSSTCFSSPFLFLLLLVLLSITYLGDVATLRAPPRQLVCESFPSRGLMLSG